MIFETNKDKGRAGMALGVAYFGANGYTVSIPLNDTQWYDFIVEKDGIFQTVQCKATGSKDGAISLKSSGGTKGTTYDNVLNHEVDLTHDFSLIYKTSLRERSTKDLKKLKKIQKKCWQITRNDVRYKTSLRYATKYLEN